MPIVRALSSKLVGLPSSLSSLSESETWSTSSTLASLMLICPEATCSSRKKRMKAAFQDSSILNTTLYSGEHVEKISVQFEDLNFYSPLEKVIKRRINQRTESL
jgi:hypothetical protein